MSVDLLKMASTEDLIRWLKDARESEQKAKQEVVRCAEGRGPLAQAQMELILQETINKNAERALEIEKELEIRLKPNIEPEDVIA